MSASMLLDNILDWMTISTVILTAFAIGASANRLKRWWAKVTNRNVKQPKRIGIRPARLWAVVKQDWQIHGNN